MILEQPDGTAEIFVAEDNRADVYLIRKALEEKQLAHRLHVAEDGEEAAAFIRAVGKEGPCPDLILLDLNLPKQDGSEILQQLRDHPRCGTKPVIVISSSDSPKDHELAHRLDATFFRKPSDLEEFMQIADLIVEKLTPRRPSLTEI
jgi:chemotaxis family two-component system response regulator Rcp1